MLEDIELSAIQDENARQLIRRLLNLIEKLSADLRDLRAEIQALRDENNHLKGEQGKPNVKANKAQPAETSQHSSEKERKKTRVRHKASKKAEFKIDREEVVKVQREELPSDAKFKGYVEVVVQDIQLKTDNVRFRKEKYYSASSGKTRYAWRNCHAGTKGSLGRASKHSFLRFILEREPASRKYWNSLSISDCKCPKASCQTC